MLGAVVLCASYPSFGDWEQWDTRKLAVGLIHIIQPVEGPTLNPVKGTPGARAEARGLLLSRILSETTLTDPREKRRAEYHL